MKKFFEQLRKKILAVRRVRVVDETTILVNLDAVPRLPFGVATVESHTGTGVVQVQRLNDGLYVCGRKVVLYPSENLSELQKGRRLIRAYDFRYEESGKPVLNANILDALYENTHLFPEEYKKDELGKIRFICLQETVYRDPCVDVLCVRGLYFLNGTWRRDYSWFRDGWMVARPVNIESKNITIDRSTPFNPADFIGAGWTIWRGPANGNGLNGVEDQDERSLALIRINVDEIELVDCLNDLETAVNGEEKQRRLKANGCVRRLDAKIFQTFWENKELIPERFKEQVNGHIRFTCFDGTVLRDLSGGRCVLCLYWREDKWIWFTPWLGHGFLSNDYSAVLSSE